MAPIIGGVVRHGHTHPLLRVKGILGAQQPRIGLRYSGRDDPAGTRPGVACNSPPASPRKEAATRACCWSLSSGRSRRMAAIVHSARTLVPPGRNWGRFQHPRADDRPTGADKSQPGAGAAAFSNGKIPPLKASVAGRQADRICPDPHRLGTRRVEISRRLQGRPAIDGHRDLGTSARRPGPVAKLDVEDLIGVLGDGHRGRPARPAPNDQSQSAPSPVVHSARTIHPPIRPAPS